LRDVTAAATTHAINIVLLIIVSLHSRDFLKSIPSPKTLYLPGLLHP
jgi:hypothetical protein